MACLLSHAPNGVLSTFDLLILTFGLISWGLKEYYTEIDIEDEEFFSGADQKSRRRGPNYNKLNVAHKLKIGLEDRAMLGDVKAQFQMANLYAREGDIQKSVDWYRQAANHGSKEAQLYIANCYTEGKVLSQDEKMALWWYERAADQGVLEAKQKMQMILDEQQHHTDYDNYGHGDGTSNNYDSKVVTALEDESLGSITVPGDSSAAAVKDRGSTSKRTTERNKLNQSDDNDNNAQSSLVVETEMVSSTNLKNSSSSSPMRMMGNEKNNNHNHNNDNGGRSGKCSVSSQKIQNRGGGGGGEEDKNEQVGGIVTVPEQGEGKRHDHNLSREDVDGGSRDKNDDNNNNNNNNNDNNSGRRRNRSSKKSAVVPPPHPNSMIHRGIFTIEIGTTFWGFISHSKLWRMPVKVEGKISGGIYPNFVGEWTAVGKVTCESQAIFINIKAYGVVILGDRTTQAHLIFVTDSRMEGEVFQEGVPGGSAVLEIQFPANDQ